MDLQEQIRKLAYQLYEDSGKVEGRDTENWLAAEKMVMAVVAVDGTEEMPKPAVPDRPGQKQSAPKANQKNNKR